MPETIERVDYNRLWVEQMRGFDHGSGVAEYWDRRSKSYHCSCWNSNYAEELMARMDLKPEYSVLDVGCGCGAMSVPLARRVCRVTALDISPIRLDKLSRRVAADGLTNITIVDRDWNKVRIGEDIGRHDIVLMSRSVPVRLSDALKKIDLAAGLACYLTWRAERTDELEAETAAAMGRKPPVYPDCSLVYRLLRRMGIPARMESFETVSRAVYPGPREAALSMAKGADIDGRQFTGLLEIAMKRLTRTSDGYSFDRRIKWVLISWGK